MKTLFSNRRSSRDRCEPLHSFFTNLLDDGQWGTGFKNFLQNFGDESQFCEILQNLVHIDFKILEKVLSRLCAHIGTNFGKF